MNDFGACEAADRREPSAARGTGTSDLVRGLVGRKITLYSMQGESERQDVGVLEAADDRWLVLRKGDRETLYFSVYHVRLIKPFEAG